MIALLVVLGLLLLGGVGLSLFFAWVVAQAVFFLICGGFLLLLMILGPLIGGGDIPYASTFIIIALVVGAFKVGRRKPKEAHDGRRVDRRGSQHGDLVRRDEPQPEHDGVGELRCQHHRTNIRT